MAKNRKIKVFLCHSSNDKSAVREFYKKLRAETWIEPWLDEEEIYPGQDWNLEIEKAVESSDVVLVFLSKNSVNKEGYVQRELRLALDVADEKPEGTIFVIPVRLDNDVSAPRRLSSLQWVDLFEKNGYQKTLKALEIRGKSHNIRERDTEQYDLDIVNDMLRDLSDEQLKNLVYEELPSLFNKINWGGYTFGKVSDIIFRAQDEDKLSNVVSWVSKNAKKIYTNYSKRLPLKFSVSVSGNYSESAVNVNRTESSNKLRNPYVAGNPIQPTNNRVFWGRLDIAEAIVHEIRGSHQKPSFLLYGRRRMGKTSTMLNLRRLIRNIKTIDVLISGQNSKYHNDNDFCFYVTEKIIKTTKESLLMSKFFEKFERFYDRPKFDDNPARALSIFFDEYHEFLESQDLYCLLMLDEYEEFGNLSRELLLQIRDTMQHKPRILFIFSGVSHINDLPNPFWSEVFINVRTLKISFLQRTDGYKLLTEPLPELVYESTQLIERILDITGCQPFLLQAIAAELVNSKNLSNKLAVSIDDLDFSIKKVFASWQNYFDGYIWKKECSTDIHKLIVKRIAREQKTKTSDFAGHSSQINDLIEKDIVKMHNGILQLTMPIVGMWLEQANYS